MYNSLQEVFNVAVTGLASQGFERSVKDDVCLYRGPNGRRCAIGWCIPDDIYDPKTETCSPEKGFFRKAYGSLFAGLATTSLTRLQSAHDSAHPSDMRMRLRMFAAQYKLTLPDVLKEDANQAL